MASVGLALGAGFYLLLIDTTDLPELIALAAIALLAAAMFELSREHGLPEGRVDPRWLLRAGRVLVRVPAHTAIVAAEAVAQLARPQPARGELRAVPFDPGGDPEGPLAIGRRALAEALGSLAPNSIVLGIDSESRLLLVHQLRRRGGREELDPLGLG